MCAYEGDVGVRSCGCACLSVGWGRMGKGCFWSPYHACVVTATFVACSSSRPLCPAAPPHSCLPVTHHTSSHLHSTVTFVVKEASPPEGFEAQGTIEEEEEREGAEPLHHCVHYT